MQDIWKLTGDTVLLDEGSVQFKSMDQRLKTYAIIEEGNHSIGIHRLSSVLPTTISATKKTRVHKTYEFKVLEVGDNLFGVCLGTLLEGLDTVRVCLSEFGLDTFHVSLNEE